MASTPFNTSSKIVVKNVTFTHDNYHLYRNNSGGRIINAISTDYLPMLVSETFTKFFVQSGSSLVIDTSDATKTMLCFVLMN